MAGNVTHLDTINFNDTISAYDNHIIRFQTIMSDVDRINETMISCWKGEGCKAYEKDCKQVQLNLKDISEIMYDLREALINAYAEYIKTDSALSKNFDS